MTKLQTFQEDCVALLREKLARGEIDRRRFLTLAGALGLTVAGGSDRAAAQGLAAQAPRSRPQEAGRRLDRRSR